MTLDKRSGGSLNSCSREFRFAMRCTAAIIIAARYSGELMRTRLVLILATVAAISTACAGGTFRQVSFAGEASPLVDSLQKTVHVVRNTQMQDTVLEARIRMKLESFLLEQGYAIAPAEQAHVYVMAVFGHGPRIVGSEAAVFRRGEVRVTRNRAGEATGRSVSPDRMEYLRVVALENSVWLMVLSSDADYFRQTGQVRNLWRGEAAMRGKPEDLPTVTPYLIVPAMRFFGKATRETILVDVRQKDLPSM